jgi:two-component system OmpR family sensor kinase
VSIARAADRVGAEVAAGEDHFTPLPPRNANDEVATLTTAFDHLIARLAAALRREREFSEQERSLLADTAHELRTPVAILQSSTEVALTSARTNEEYRVALESIAQESRALSALVNDLLLFSRRDSHGPLQIPAPMYLDDAVSSCLERIRTLPEAQGRHIQIGELEAAPVRADMALIERAVLALVHNALVHAPDSPVEVSTGISDTNGTRESWVRVRDWGPGIERDSHAMIFDRFARLDTTKPGTGLGLSIVQLIVEASGGRIVLESSPGDGATFTLLLPATSPAPVA